MKETALKKILSSKPLSYLLALLLFFALVSVGREISRQINIKKELNSLKEQTTALELENQKLVNDLEKIQTEYFREKAARLQLGLRKPGERMIVIIPSESSGESGTNEEKYFQRKISNLKIWWQKFFPSREKETEER